MSRLLALLALSVATPASAIAPDPHIHQGVAPDRLVRYHVELQQELADRPAWRAFLAGEGRGWNVRFDEQTGAPFRMMGPGLSLGGPGVVGPADSGNTDWVSAVRRFVESHAALLGVSPATLGEGVAVFSEPRQTWYIDFPAYHDGVPVRGGGVTARVQRGRLVLLGVETFDGRPRLGERVLSADEAARIAIDLGPEPTVDHEIRDVREVWLPRELPGGLTMVRVYEVRTETRDPVGKWVAHVDAETGELHNVYNEVLYFRGTVTGQHHARKVTDALITSPLVDMRVEDENTRRVQTDDSGVFELPGSSFTLTFRGDDLRVVDALDGQTAQVRFGQTDLLVTSAQASQAEISTWVFLQKIQAWGEKVAPEVDVRGSGVLVSNVNVSGNCNAFFDGSSVNFFREGGGCNNTALIADVNWHEWGHGFHAASLLRGEFDGSISEGAADTVAFLQTNDNIIAPTFSSRGNGIRDVAPNRVYPRDVVNEVHTDGLIFAGAMWDLVAELTPRYGNAGAREVVGGILAGTLKGGPNLASVGEEVILADDDDGDLANGTPHFCEILDALGAHGLAPTASLSGLVRHDQLIEAEPDALVLGATANDTLNLECVDLEGLTLRWREAGGEWQQEAAVVEGESLEAQIPELPYGTFVEYFFETSGGVTVPTAGEYAPLSLYAGGVLPVLWNTDFEADDAGFTSALVSGTDQEGANDWMWGTPTGVGGDPAIAASGVRVWGNDLGGGRFNGQYQPDKQNRLSSPELSFPSHLEDVFLRYSRWLHIEDGQFDRANILADGQVVWTNHGSSDPNGAEHHLEDRWVTHSVALGEAATDGKVRLEWEIISDQGLEFGGWTLDDVALFAPATPNNRLAILDFVASDDTEGGVELTWTNPEFAPLVEVVVVRKEGSAPTGPDDGDVVFRDEAPELGAPASAFDDTGKSGVEYHYAVYGGDGEAWLGWTRSGLNSDLGSGFGQPKNGRLVAGGCSCDTGSTGMLPTWLAAGGVLLAWARRRRV